MTSDFRVFTHIRKDNRTGLRIMKGNVEITSTIFSNKQDAKRARRIIDKLRFYLENEKSREKQIFSSILEETVEYFYA